MAWQTTWTQAMTDVSAARSTFNDLTLRSEVTVTIAGDRFRLELSNAFGSEPVVLGRIGVTVGGRPYGVKFEGCAGVVIPAGGSVRSDPVDVAVRRGHVLMIDMHLPEPTVCTTANVFGGACWVSQPGDHVGRVNFPAIRDITLSPAEEGLTLSAPWVRSVEVSGGDASAVVVCLGDSITVMGWPGIVETLLPATPRVAVLNRGVAGNRLLLDPAPQVASFGRAGLKRFDEDVLATVGVTHVVIALGTNDLGHPGTMAPLEQLPSAAALVAGYRELIASAEVAGVRVLLSSIAPFLPAVGYDAERDGIREEVNTWIRSAPGGHVDFDAALRSPDDPSRLAAEYDGGDHLHPSVVGQAHMAEVFAARLIDVLDEPAP